MATISSSETFAKRRAIFLSVRKTVNIQGYSKLREPIKNARKLLSTDLVNTKYIHVYVCVDVCVPIVFTIILSARGSFIKVSSVFALSIH